MLNGELPEGRASIEAMIVAAVKAQTEQAMAANEERILDSVQKSVSEAIETKYRVVIGRLGAEKEGKDSHLWQIILAVIPVVLTIGLGWWVSRGQTAIERKIDQQKQELTTKLALTQEYQKRKLDVYQKCSTSMNVLADSLQPLRLYPKDSKDASDAVRELYDCAKNNPLYVTKDVAALLAQVQDDAIVVMQKAPNVDTTALEKDILAAENKMLQELTGVTVPLNSAQ